MNRQFSSEAQQVAEGVLVEKGRSFHWARRLLGKKHAARATRLYALCRYLDDLADEATSLPEAQAALAGARHAIETGHTTDPRLLDGLHLLQECTIDPAILLELIRGITSDLGQVRVADEAELVRYCYRVAGTVGLMMCQVLDVTEEAALAHAVDLGIAMQLTNICRDVAEDAAAGRRYLPASLVGELDPAELVSPAESLQPQLRGGLANLLQRADYFYQSGELGLPYLPLQARCGILIAARVYRAIGSRLRQRDCNYWIDRAVVSDWEKAGISLRALATVPLCRAFWHCRDGHRTELHRHLAGLPGLGGHFEK
jgi:15-cis-phytoene synthase